MNNGSRLANGTSGQAGTTSFLARRAVRRVRDAAATLRRDDVAVREPDRTPERSHRFTIVSGRVDRENVKGTFGLSLSWRNAGRRERTPRDDGPLAVMRVHVDLRVPRWGRDVSCHRAFFFGSVPESGARRVGTAPARPSVEPAAPAPEPAVIDLRALHDDDGRDRTPSAEPEPGPAPVHEPAEENAPRAGLFADNPVVEHERDPVPTREPAPVRIPLFTATSVLDRALDAEPVVERAHEPVVERAHEPVVERAPEPGRTSEPVVVADASPAREDNAADPDAPRPEGWHPDPVGHAELRYWDGHRWTAHISTGGRLWLSPIDAARPGSYATPG